jgi:hypothetical protein
VELFDVGEQARMRLAAVEQRDLVLLGPQRFDEVRPEKPGAAEDQDLHGVVSSQNPKCADPARVAGNPPGARPHVRGSTAL